MNHPLDDMIWGSLNGEHRPLALRTHAAARYRDGMPPFCALEGDQGEALEELSSLMQPEGLVALADAPAEPLAPGWKHLTDIRLIQLVGEQRISSPEVVPQALSVDDVPAMLELVELTQPGPFGPRSIELGRFVGYRDDRDVLIAMAGERLRPPGYTEITAVCTHPDHQRKGLGEAATRSIGADIQRRGEVPFLHIDADKAEPLTAFYARLGFVERRPVTLAILQWLGVPESA